ncbi:HAD family phosphatase [Conexibacter sp. SYSU D00693]|uniref:HAD family hydrolase n=1 Tax=Conexibacter sp. SYSU D00693 TaxID=2812560 RepID=UPI00196B45D3|nr:HAD family phosphatase [Conexibacter sp. SYSU D00693]
MAEARRGLLMDWGGVMTTNLFAAFQRFCEAESLAPEAVRKAFLEDPRGRELLVEFESGRMELDPFQQGLAEVLGLAADRAPGLVERLFSGMAIDDAMVAAVQRFRAAGIRTGILSNSWGPAGASYDLALFDELFDVRVISGEEGVRKPEQRIYDLAVERMGMPASELVFVDDLPGNLKPARAMGVHTIAHREAAATIAELEQVLGVSAGAPAGADAPPASP